MYNALVILYCGGKKNTKEQENEPLSPVVCV
jgi:hypothetical protein